MGIYQQLELWLQFGKIQLSVTHLSIHIMNTVTDGPQAIQGAAITGLRNVMNSFYNYGVTLATGDAAQRGNALGELGTSAVLGSGSG